MSGNIRSKDLAYDAALPPFLQRLREQNAGRADPDRHERQIARPKLAANANDDDDDNDPTVVDETGEIMTHKNFKEQAAATATRDVPQKEDTLPADIEANLAEQTPAAHTKQQVTVGLTSKKRKAGKVIADGAPIAADNGDAIETVKKAKKRSKPIRLAFEDNDEDI